MTGQVYAMIKYVCTQRLTTASRLLAQRRTTLRPVALILAVRWSTATFEGAQTSTCTRVSKGETKYVHPLQRHKSSAMHGHASASGDTHGKKK